MCCLAVPSVCLLWCGCTYKLFSAAESIHTQTQTHNRTFFMSASQFPLRHDNNNLPAIVKKKEGGPVGDRMKSDLPAACTTLAVFLLYDRSYKWSCDEQCWSRQLFPEPQPFCSNSPTIHANLLPVNDWRLVGISYGAECTAWQMTAGDNESVCFNLSKRINRFSGCFLAFVLYKETNHEKYWVSQNNEEQKVKETTAVSAFGLVEVRMSLLPVGVDSTLFWL